MSIPDKSEEDARYYWLDLEGDYESNYKNGWRPDPYGESVIPVGLCTMMCTPEEMYERETQKRLSRFEVRADSNPPKVHRDLAIKEFSRSAAGREFTRALDLRPWSVLNKAMRHLLLDICMKKDDWMYVCDFVFDRLKAVRQDMIIQRIEGSRYVLVLEGSIRFLLYSLYRLTCTLKDYTLSQPMKVILSTRGPLTGLDNYELHVVREMKLTMQSLRDCMQSLIVQYKTYVPNSPNRALFEAINLIINMPIGVEYQYQMTDLLGDKEERNKYPFLATVFKMYLEHLAGNHMRAMNLLKELREYPLIVIAYAPVIAQLQIHLMSVIKKAHASKGPSRAHPDKLCKLLCPQWLDISYDERLIFTIFMAIQFDVFDANDDEIDFCSASSEGKVIQGNYNEKARIMLARQSAQEADGENETRTYAMQMITARDWSFFKETLKVYGVESVLDPYQQ